ncbi:MAG: hypothetical protein ABDI07_10480 [Candidatus Kryptonium sp.]
MAILDRVIDLWKTLEKIAKSEEVANSLESLLDSSTGKLLKFFVKGKPVTFATSLERVWKEELRRGIPERKISGETGLKLKFYLSSFDRMGQPFDLDNLVEPVFSVLVGEKGYFGGRRTNIKWWYAKREISSGIEGVEIELCTGYSSSVISGRQILDEEFREALPQSLKNSRIPDWLKAMQIGPIHEGERFSVNLQFPAQVNIGEIPTGPVKIVIDSLYPIFGGSERSPNDWKVDELLIEKRETIRFLKIRVCGK